MPFVCYEINKSSKNAHILLVHVVLFYRSKYQLEENFNFLEAELILENTLITAAIYDVKSEPQRYK